LKLISRLGNVALPALAQRAKELSHEELGAKSGGRGRPPHTVHPQIRMGITM
jgi:hypothetical protein